MMANRRPGGPLGRPALAVRSNPFQVPNQRRRVAAAPAAGAPETAAAPEQAPSFQARPNPFKVPWQASVPPPPPVFQVVQPERIATAQVETPPPLHTTERVVPDRRVSGILMGDGIYAILEGAGDPEIVRPGSKTSDGYRVEAIGSDSVTLQKVEGNVTYTQIVPLSDTTTSTVSATGRGGTGGFRPGGTGGGLRPAGPGRGPGGRRGGRGFRPGGA
jgi:hypothetical protein